MDLHLQRVMSIVSLIKITSSRDEPHSTDWLTATELRGQHLRWFNTQHRWTEGRWIVAAWIGIGFIKSSDICASNLPSWEDASVSEIDRILSKEQHVFKNMTTSVCFQDQKYYQSKQDILWGFWVEGQKIRQDKASWSFLCGLYIEVFSTMWSLHKVGRWLSHVGKRPRQTTRVQMIFCRLNMT